MKYRNAVVDPKSPVSLKENPLLQHSNSNNNRSRTFSVRSCESEMSGSSRTDKPGIEPQMSVVSSTQEEKTNSMYHIVKVVCTDLVLNMDNTDHYNPVV
jgi:hypothetical protein